MASSPLGSSVLRGSRAARNLTLGRVQRGAAAQPGAVSLSPAALLRRRERLAQRRLPRHLGTPGAPRTSPPPRAPTLPQEQAEDTAALCLPVQHAGSAPAAAPEAQPGTYVIVLGQSPFVNRRHPTPHLLLISHRRGTALLLKPLLPRHPHSSTKAQPYQKPRGITPNPKKHRCAQRRPKRQMLASPSAIKCQLWGED